MEGQQGELNMDKVLLYGHTGSTNHGCEAIVRSTIDIMRENDLICDLASFQPEQDRVFNLDKLVNDILVYRGYNKTTAVRVYNGLMKKLFHNRMPEQRYVQRDIFQRLSQYSITLVIGGDTYCYKSGPYHAYALNRYADRKGNKTVLWSCSIGKENMTEEMIEDLNRYTKIYPREGLTYKNLLEIGIPEERICRMSDSAFIMPAQETTLPEGFENVVAYNPSYTIHKSGDNVPEARVHLIQSLLSETNYNVALIPHVFYDGNGDAAVCRELYEKFKSTGRVFLFDANYNCCQLKHIISRCNFLIAERTHASIAGYSTYVPTFVLGYSVKAIGIANDLFGTSNGYVLSASDLANPFMYWEAVRSFMAREKEIKMILHNKIPAYQNMAHRAGMDLKSQIG